MEIQTTKLPLSDERIIALYWSRDEKTIEETDIKYRNYLYKVAYNIVHGEKDCEECLNDTYIFATALLVMSQPLSCSLAASCSWVIPAFSRNSRIFLPTRLSISMFNVNHLLHLFENKILDIII